MIKVLIADDHAIVRQGLKQILSEIPDMMVVGEAVDGQETLHKVRAEAPHVLVLDLTMPGRSGFDLLQELKHEAPNLPVLILSMHSEAQFGPRVLKAGAAGYITKESVPDELVKAIRKVMDGGKYISPSLAERLATDLRTDRQGPPHEGLSDRELQVRSDSGEERRFRATFCVDQ